jgi:hypothetical protein
MATEARSLEASLIDIGIGINVLRTSKRVSFRLRFHEIPALHEENRALPKAILSNLNNGVIKVSRFLFNWICSARRTCCCPPFVCGWKASSFSSQSSCWQEGVDESFLAADVNDADEEDMDLFNDDSSDEDSAASVTSELLIILRKGLCRPNYK